MQRQVAQLHSERLGLMDGQLGSGGYVVDKDVDEFTLMRKHSSVILRCLWLTKRGQRGACLRRRTRRMTLIAWCWGEPRCGIAWRTCSRRRVSTEKDRMQQLNAVERFCMVINYVVFMGMFDTLS